MSGILIKKEMIKLELRIKNTPQCETLKSIYHLGN